MHLRLHLICITLLLVFGFKGHGQKELTYENKSYEPNIRSVQLLPRGQQVQSRTAPAIKNIREGANLILEFDDLKEDADYYFVRFIHCNADWSPSDMRAGMYVKGYNEFEIEDFEFSTESKLNYVHYRFPLPEFKFTGNYLAVVYRDRNKEDIVLSKRFMIYENRSAVGGRIMPSSDVSKRLTHQRIEVLLNYNEVTSMDPMRDFKVYVMQNHRPDQRKQLNTTFLDENQKTIRYQNLNSENEFAGGNEFRFFDLSTVNANGRNIGQISFVNNRPVAQVMIDQPGRDSYFQALDLNGQFFIRDLESGQASLAAEYVQTNFSLKVPKSRSNYYIIGAFNQWRKDDDSRMVYNDATQRYEISLLLKQGWYDYMYWSEDPLDELEIENSFYDTENLYEVFVYFRAMGKRGDELIGYHRIDFNTRR